VINIILHDDKIHCTIKALVPEAVAQTEIFAEHGMYPVSLPGSESIPAVVDATPPILHLILSVFVEGASNIKPTVLAGAVAVVAVVPVKEVLSH
jgi:hypothetical protein